jgi:hypothetical protein
MDADGSPTLNYKVTKNPETNSMILGMDRKPDPSLMFFATRDHPPSPHLCEASSFAKATKDTVGGHGKATEDGQMRLIGSGLFRANMFSEMFSLSSLGSFVAKIHLAERTRKIRRMGAMTGLSMAGDISKRLEGKPLHLRISEIFVTLW